MQFESWWGLQQKRLDAYDQRGARLVSRAENKLGLQTHAPRRWHPMFTGLCTAGCGTRTAVRCQECFAWVCLDHMAQCLWCHQAFCLPCNELQETDDVCGSCAERQRKSVVCFFCSAQVHKIARKSGCSVADLIEIACADLHDDPDHKSALLVVCREKKGNPQLAMAPHTCASCGKCQCKMDCGWLRLPAATWDKEQIVCAGFDGDPCLKKLQMQTLLLGLT